MFVGRRSELESLQSALRVQRRNVILSGRAGVGKTALVNRFLDTADPPLEVIRADCLPGVTVPLSPFRHLLSAIDEPAEHPIDRVLQLKAAIARAAGNGDFVLAIDDLQWVDDASATLLHSVVADSVLPVVVAVRTSEATPPSVSWIWDEGRFDHIRLGPLARSECDDLVGRSLAGEVTSSLNDAIWSIGGGTPLYVSEALRVARITGSIYLNDAGAHDLSESIELPDSTHRLIALHLQELPDTARELLETITVGAPLDLSIVDLLPNSDLLDVLVEEGFIRIVDDGVQLAAEVTHDLKRSAALAGMSDVRRRTAARRLISAIESHTEASPRDVMGAAKLRLEIDDSSADAYLAGANAALSMLDFESALELAEASEAAGGGFRAHLLRACTLSPAGREAESTIAFDVADRAAGSEGERVEAAVMRAVDSVMFRSRPEDAIDTLDAAEGTVSDPSSRAALAAFRSTVHFYAGDAHAAVRDADSIFGSPFFQPESAVALCSAWAVLGRPERVLEAYEAALDAMPSGSEPPYFLFHNLPWCRMISLLQLGRIRESEDIYAPMRQRNLAAGGIRSDLALTCMPATYQYLVGHLGVAAQLYEQAMLVLDMQPGHVRSFNRTLMATMYAQMNRVGDGEAELERARSVRSGSRAAFAWWEERAEALLCAASGNVDTAVAMSMSLADRFADHWLYATTSLHDVVRFDRPERAVAGLEACTERPGATWWDLTCAQHARAVVDGDQRALIEVADRFECGGLDLLALEAYVTAGRMRGDASAATTIERACERLQSLCDGAHTHLLDLPHPLLTRRETQVARLAAAGKSNAEIAVKLGSSVRTIENQLASAYRKLGINRRTELEAAL